METKSTAITKKRALDIKEKIDILKDHNINPAPPPEAVEVEEVPFGGGTLVGLIVNPTSQEVQALTGFDEFGFSHSRSYGCSQYLPLMQHCSKLMEADNPVDRMVGHKHIADRFMVKRSSAAKFSLAEEAIYIEANNVGQHLLERGALYPLTFPSISVLGHNGHEPLPGHWIPSCGFTGLDVSAVFEEYMSNPYEWLLTTRLEMAELLPKIERGEIAPLRGYQK